LSGKVIVRETSVKQIWSFPLLWLLAFTTACTIPCKPWRLFQCLNGRLKLVQNFSKWWRRSFRSIRHWRDRCFA